MTAVELATKACNACEQEQPLTQFYRNRKAPDGLSWECKDCTNTRVRRSRDQRRARMGDAAWLAHQRGIARRSRERADIERRTLERARQEAYDAATRTLRDFHRGEFEAIVWFWQLACSVANVPDTPDIRERALESLRNAEAHPDPFEGFPQGWGF